MKIHNLELQLQRKAVKHMRLVVYPPDGRVRLSVPMGMSDTQVYSFVLSRLPWIKKQQAYFRARPRPPVLQMVTGELLYVWGKLYPLKVIERYGRHEMMLKDETMQLFIRSGTSTVYREKVLTEWYRTRLKQRLPEMLNHWQAIIGVEVTGWNVRKMKACWGNCYPEKKQIQLNLHLAQKPLACLEYVLVHELIHLLEPYHNQHFYDLLDRFLPHWQQCRQILNS